MTRDLAPAPNRAAGYRPDIDGLRALAVLAVIAFHAFPAQVGGGFCGVDVFFVISGFLISGIIFDELRARRFSYASFYARRIRRIFPALLLVLAACAVAGWFVMATGQYRSLGKHIAAGALFVSNLALWNEAGYFDAAAETKPLLHLWSLGVEEQFYIVWPLLLGLAWRRRWNLPLLIALIALASFGLNLYWTETRITAAFYSPFTRFWELMAGGALAWLRFARPQARVPAPDALSVAGLLLIALGVALLDGATAFPGWAALLPVLGTAAVIAAGPRAWCNRRLLAARPVVAVGLISYPLYLWHWPLLVFADHADWLPAGMQARLLAVLASFALAWATYALLEIPVRRRQPAGPMLAALGGTMAALCLAGGIVFQAEGLGFRTANQAFLDNQRWQETTGWTDADHGSAACRAAFMALDYCMLDAAAPAPSVALIGDSFSNMFYYGLRDYYRARGRTLLQAGNGNCPPLLGIESNFVHWDGTLCVRVNDAYFRKIAADPRINTVILAGNWHLYLNGGRLRPRPEKRPDWKLKTAGLPESASNAQVFEATFERTVKYFQDAGKRVIFMHQTPELDYRLDDCAPRRGEAASCRTALAKEMAYLGEYRNIVEPMLKRHPEVAVVDPVGLFCDREFCYPRRDGIDLYRDDVHLSRQGSAWLGARVTLPD